MKEKILHASSHCNVSCVPSPCWSRKFQSHWTHMTRNRCYGFPMHRTHYILPLLFRMQFPPPRILSTVDTLDGIGYRYVFVPAMKISTSLLLALYLPEITGHRYSPTSIRHGLRGSTTSHHQHSYVAAMTIRIY